jgi:recombination protein RecT
MTDQQPQQQMTVSQQRHPIVILRERLESRATELKAAMPDVPPERFIRAVVTAAQINPDILACTWNTVWLACMKACRDGLLPDGNEGAIVAYKEKASWIPMYKGLLRKFMQSGQFKMVTANCVYEGEEFAHWIDENGEHLKHVPGDKNDDNLIRRVYALATTKAGGTSIAVLPIAEVNKIRKMSRATREDAPWNAWFSEMAKKTALRRLSKLLPSAPIIVEEDEEGTFEEAPALAAAISSPSSTPRTSGAAAALDLFAGSSEDSSVRAEAPSTGDSGETGGGVQRQPGGDSAAPTTDPASTPSAATVAQPDTRAEAWERAAGTSTAGTSTAASGHTERAAESDPFVTDDPLAAAYRRGTEAKQRGETRRALPMDYRTPERDPEAKCWMDALDGKPFVRYQLKGN